MENSVNVTVSGLEKEVFKENISLTRRVYLECSCNSLCDIGRISVYKEIEKGMIVLNDVTFELPFKDPASNYICHQVFRTPWDHFIYPFKKIGRRFKLAWEVITFKKVYVGSDLAINFKDARVMATKLLEVLDGMEKENGI
jgi:hypothetical protein